MNLKNLFTADYWFVQPAPAVKEVYWIWVMILLVITAIGFAGLLARRYIQERTMKMVLEKMSQLCLTMGSVGLIFFFFRQQNVYLLGWRMWFLLWFIILVVWKARIVWFYFKRIPQIRLEEFEKMRKEKYLPGKK